MLEQGLKAEKILKSRYVSSLFCMRNKNETKINVIYFFPPNLYVDVEKRKKKDNAKTVRQKNVFRKLPITNC